MRLWTLWEKRLLVKIMTCCLVHRSPLRGRSSGIWTCLLTSWGLSEFPGSLFSACSISELRSGECWGLPPPTPLGVRARHCPLWSWNGVEEPAPGILMASLWWTHTCNVGKESYKFLEPPRPAWKFLISLRMHSYLFLSNKAFPLIYGTTMLWNPPSGLISM